MNFFTTAAIGKNNCSHFRRAWNRLIVFCCDIGSDFNQHEIIYQIPPFIGPIACSRHWAFTRYENRRYFDWPDSPDTGYHSFRSTFIFAPTALGYRARDAHTRTKVRVCWLFPSNGRPLNFVFSRPRHSINYHTVKSIDIPFPINNIPNLPLQLRWCNEIPCFTSNHGTFTRHSIYSFRNFQETIEFHEWLPRWDFDWIIQS